MTQQDYTLPFQADFTEIAALFCRFSVKSALVKESDR